MVLRVRELTAEEGEQIKRLSQARTAPVRAVERARIIQLAQEGHRVPAIAATLGLHAATVRLWLKRFNAEGLTGLGEAPRPGRVPIYGTEQISEVIATALTPPQELGQAFGCWTFERLEIYLNEVKGIAMKRSRIHELLHREGLRWRQDETWFGARVDPDFAQKRGASRPSTRLRPRAAS
jgi:transposase